MPDSGSGANRPRLLVVVAHPDDETFGCGSLLLHAAAVGAVTGVCCATRGEAGQPAPDSGIAVGQLGAVREQELREAARLLGVTYLELLDFTDSGMTDEPAPQMLVGVPFEDVCAQVRAQIEKFRPDVLVTLDGGDGHRDHVRIRDASLAAVEASAHRVAKVYLQCLPQSLMRRWLEHLARENPGSEHLLIDVPGTADELITTVVATEAHLHQREVAIAAHHSQVSPYEGLPPDLRHAFLTAEQLRRVVPPWPGGARETDIFEGLPRG